MKDPVMTKLQADAGEVFRGLWALVSHQPAHTYFDEDEFDENPGQSNPMCLAFRQEFGLTPPDGPGPAPRR